MLKLLKSFASGVQIHLNNHIRASNAYFIIPVYCFMPRMNLKLHKSKKSMFSPRNGPVRTPTCSLFQEICILLSVGSANSSAPYLCLRFYWIWSFFNMEAINRYKQEIKERLTFLFYLEKTKALRRATMLLSIRMRFSCCIFK